MNSSQSIWSNRRAEVIGIDGEARVVKTRAGAFPFDFLVIATGAMHSYFGHENWAAVAPGAVESNLPKKNFSISVLVMSPHLVV